MILDELTVPDVAGVATLTDPEAGRTPQCGCGGCGNRQRGTMPGWHLRKGPAPVLSARLAAIHEAPDDWGQLNLTAYRAGLRCWDYLDRGDHGDSRQLLMPSWVDHAYRLRLADGRWRYVAEPYQLNADAFADLAHLAANGFDVTVTSWRARHYPGHTVAVEITPQEGRS